jgi:hypothetical protein
MSKEDELKNLPRTFMEPAYVREVEPGTFAMYRDIVVEENGKREKSGKPIGPMGLFRQAKKGETVDFMTSKPDGTVIQLHRFYPPREEIFPPGFEPK